MHRKIQKKLKEKKMNFMDKIPIYLKKHKYLALVENTDFGSVLLNKIRNELEDTNIIFVKKKLLNKKYNIANDKNFFLVFTNEKGLEDIKKYKYKTYPDVNHLSTKDVIINKGQIKNKELADLLPIITEKNITILEDDYVVCLKNEPITEKQVKILKHMKEKLKEEFIRLIHVYETKDINKLD